jgi:ParB-like chromosome segregation protein Spo0J
VTDPVVWNGPEALRELLVPLAALERHPQNPRRGRVHEIAESLGRFGQVRPVLAHGHRIVAGNHTYLAAADLGWTHVAVVQHTFADDQEARAYLLADNRLPELGDYEPVPFAGGFAVDPAALAARAEHLAGGRQMHEFILLLPGDQAADFEQHLAILRREYGDGGGVTETVFRALQERARRVQQA